MKGVKISLQLGIVIFLLVFAGYLPLLIPVGIVLGIGLLCLKMIDNKFLAAVIAYIAIMYVSSIFELIIYYFSGSDFILKLETGYLLISFLMVSSWIELVLSAYISNIGIIIQWIIFVIGTITVLIFLIPSIISVDDY
jgi:hypothetical protein